MCKMWIQESFCDGAISFWGHSFCPEQQDVRGPQWAYLHRPQFVWAVTQFKKYCYLTEWPYSEQRWWEQLVLSLWCRLIKPVYQHVIAWTDGKRGVSLLAGGRTPLGVCTLYLCLSWPLSLPHPLYIFHPVLFQHFVVVGFSSLSVSAIAANINIHFYINYNILKIIIMSKFYILYVWSVMLE